MSNVLPPGFSLSTLVHIFAQYPNAIIVYGLTALLGLATLSPIGPGIHLGSEEALQDIEATLLSTNNVPREDQIAAALDKVRFKPITSEAIEYIFSICHCDHPTVEDLRQDQELLELVKRIYYLDLLNRYNSKTDADQVISSTN